jgi:hypothetical protein
MLLKLGLGTLQSGIRASGSNTGLGWARIRSELVKFVVADFVCDNLGKNEEFREKSPNLWEKI